MGRWHFSHSALLSSVVLASLAGCGGSQPPIGRAGAMPQSHVVFTRAERGRSWMLPEAKSEDLLYVSDAEAISVYVFSYPGGKSVGSLNGLAGSPDQVCSDTAGNVFVTEYPSAIQEYTHGGTTPIATLGAPGEPEECSVDPTSGNLAVGIYTYRTSSPTGVAIYAKAQGTPTLYRDSNFSEMIACSYDDHGNLFVAGLNGEDGFALAELRAGSSTFVNVTLKERIGVSARADIQWTGGKLAIGDYVNARQYLIYRVAISGKRAQIVGDTQPNLKDQSFGGDTAFFIHGSRIAMNVETGKANQSRVLLWPYPRGGTHLAGTPRFGSLYSDGVTVSAAQQ